MASRLNLQQELETLLGSKNVYYQPPASIKIKYPAIIYSRSNIDTRFADSSVYKQNNAYNIIVIYEDPDSDIPDKILQFPYCSFDRNYVSDNLNHSSFTLYY